MVESPTTYNGHFSGFYLFNFWLVFVKKKKIVEDLAIEYTNKADFPIDPCVIVDRLRSHATNTFVSTNVVFLFSCNNHQLLCRFA